MERRHTHSILGAIVLLVVALCFVSSTAFMAAAIVTKARAHSFYPHECCHDQDCWPMGDGADAREPEPKATPQGWLLSDGTIVAYRDARPSPDGRFHACRRGGQASGEVIRPEGRKPCLFAPQQSF